ncbi:TIGR02300 family protein [Pararhizobium haloflavum]|uniref:TIGR02300 family protein n=1 Tax=Pararhizobium haloflavum TaxID=2037914 RepID=UPI000C1901CC|nr:TIGR02300 family protein [Pararhizobium haloflavum]
MAKPELGTKRVCPETGRKFYDLNRDPIVSPYTGKTYPLSYFEDTAAQSATEKDEEEDVQELDAEASEVEAPVKEDADGDDDSGDKDDLPDLEGDDEVEIDDDDDDTFLPDDDDDEDDDMSDIIGGVNEDEEES